MPESRRRFPRGRTEARQSGPLENTDRPAFQPLDSTLYYAALQTKDTCFDGRLPPLRTEPGEAREGGP